MSNILVTGGAGFIGANFVRYWKREHPDDFLVVLDALTYSARFASISALVEDGRVGFVQANIAERTRVEQLLREHKIDTIVHFAAESHVDRSIEGPEAFVQTNIVGTHALLAAARQVWLEERTVARHRFHHISTDEVFGTLSETDPAFHENTPYAPNSPYAASKAASDHLVRAYHHTFGLAVTTSNCSNNYGPYQFPEKLIPLVLLNALHGKELPVYGDGAQIRDWLHVEDHCRAIDAILAGGSIGETYNVGGGGERRNLQVVEGICDAVDACLRAQSALRDQYASSPVSQGRSTRELIRFVRDRPGHDRRYAIDGRKIHAGLGYAPRVTFEAGLRDTVRWYLDNRDWWLPIVSGSEAGRGLPPHARSASLQAR